MKIGNPKRLSYTSQLNKKVITRDSVTVAQRKQGDSLKMYI